MSASKRLDIAEKIDFQFDVIRRYDHYIATTNFKIGLLLSFLVAVFVGLLFRVTSLVLQSDHLTFILAFFSTLVVLAELSAIWYLIRAVSPNLETVKYRSYIFFGDVSSWDGSAEGYYDDFSKTSKDVLLRDLTMQTHSVAKVASEKFRLIGIATRITLCAVLPLLGMNFMVMMLQ